jgi:hypothetical protein
VSFYLFGGFLIKGTSPMISNIGEVPFPKIQASRSFFLSLVEKIGNEEPILTVSSVIGDDLQNNCFQKRVFCEKLGRSLILMPSLQTMTVLCSKHIDPGFAEQF